MTNQEVLDKVWRHFITDGRAPGIREGQCYYRGARNIRCAIGCLIPDDLYSTKIEYDTIDCILGTHPEIDTFFQGVDTDLLESVQMHHDSWNEKELFKPYFRKHLIRIAIQWGLKIPGRVPKEEYDQAAS